MKKIFLENSIHQAIKSLFFFLGKLPKKKLFIFESFSWKNSIVIIHVQFF